ncbi:hypothetical protein [Lysinibacter sp. HNR]|uniref:hypothetical protein n=1 Tax=Lysinibacter sp. HNR TaxID=3031408 RepID=UPI002434A2F9|nr:hypothetical protein [Lysinibacter sp. HNR]WGD37214.1 hypothetical protein FrondiHNR_12395 [Lysinibacter sp. HNR]
MALDNTGWFGVGARVSVFRGGALLAIAGLVATVSTSAGFNDASFATATVKTEVTPAALPVPHDQSANSTLKINRFGELYVTGNRVTGDGNGGTPAIDSEPTRVNFPEGSIITQAAGSTNDFHYSNNVGSYPTSFGALDSTGKVWSWGRTFPGDTNGQQLIGRGPITRLESQTVGQVTQTTTNGVTASGTLPPIIQLSRAENQYLALDADGNLWAWGYGGENLPTPFRGNSMYPALSNTVTTTPGNRACVGGDTVAWHSIWGGNNAAGAVSQNGLIYTWGYDNSDGESTIHVSQRCPILNPGANKALFSAYPDLYRDGAGNSYDGTVTRYDAIVEEMLRAPMPACAGAKATPVFDDGGCPVRQLGFGARAPRMLLQNGDLYTWMISPNTYYGFAFLGRESDTSLTPGSSRYLPAVAMQNVRLFSAGVSSITALTHDGKAWGWGRNNFCQAIGVHQAPRAGTPCSVEVGESVTLPTRVADIPQEQTIDYISSTQCATWAQSADGAAWAWGGGRIAGYDYVQCKDPGLRVVGIKIYDLTQATEDNLFGLPVRAAATGTIKVR